MYAVLWLITTIIEIFTWIIIAQVVLSWLVHFNVVNPRNQFVDMIGTFLYRATEPVLAPIRRVLPSLGGLDFSPVVAILLLQFLNILIARDIAPALLY